jgi:hypothetical protein
MSANALSPLRRALALPIYVLALLLDATGASARTDSRAALASKPLSDVKDHDGGHAH